MLGAPARFCTGALGIKFRCNHSGRGSYAIKLYPEHKSKANVNGFSSQNVLHIDAISRKMSPENKKTFSVEEVGSGGGRGQG